VDSLDVLRLVVDACAAPARVRTVLGFALRDVAADYAKAVERAAEAERRAGRMADALDTMRAALTGSQQRTAEAERRAELAEAALDDATRLIGDRIGS